ncbi:MAG TPA: hypothetical protein VGX21_20345 [Methylomirabilota bacterium]|jgi:hypothetical protein|nr:hypothetical protein [Methylomirabilota bacterium]
MRATRAGVTRLLVLAVLLLPRLVLAADELQAVPLHSVGEARGLAEPAPGAEGRPRVKPFLTRDPAARSAARQRLPGAPAPTDGFVADGAPGIEPRTVTTVLQQFEGLSNADNADLLGTRFTPPDPNLGVGPSHVFQMVNSVGRITDKLGTAITSFTLRGFFGVDAGFEDTDPRVTYDAASGRWFAVELQYSPFPASSGTSSLVLAVSTSSDPTGLFCRYRIGNPTTETFLQDFPILGLSDDKVIVAYNGFDFATANFVGAGYYVLNKADLTGCASPVRTQRVGPNPFRFTIHPAYAGTPTTTAYLVMHDTSTTLALLRVSGVPGVSPVTETAATLFIRPWTMPPTAVQAGFAGHLDTGDDRVLSAVWRGGALWLAGNEGCVPPGDFTTRSCLRLIEVSTDAPALRQDLTFGSAAEYAYYPAVQPDGAGNLHVVFTRSSATAFAGVHATGRLATDPLNTLQASTELRAGGGAQTGSDRMGDYAGAALDPSAPFDVWVIGEYVAAGPIEWETLVARLGFGPSPPTPPTLMVIKAGTGTGRVRSAPPGIDCGVVCQAAYAGGTVVALEAAPDLGSAFLGWAGACGGTGPCTLTLTADLSVTAIFDQILRLVANQTTFRPGETLVLDLRVANPGAERLVDVYFGALLPRGLGPACPGGDPVIFLADAFTRSVLTCLGGPVSTFAPLYRHTTLPGALPLTVIPSFFRFGWPADLPAGAYTLFVALTVADALGDALLAPGEIFVIATLTVTFAPP